VTGQAWQVLGLVDDVDECCCCGRTGLVATVAVLPECEVEPLYFGRTCAARYVGVTVAQLDRQVREVARAERAAAEAERRARVAQRARLYDEWLRRTIGHGNDVDLVALGFRPLDLLRRFRAELADG
jgi:hypothetical protein